MRPEKKQGSDPSALCTSHVEDFVFYPKCNKQSLQALNYGMKCNLKCKRSFRMQYRKKDCKKTEA